MRDFIQMIGLVAILVAVAFGIAMLTKSDATDGWSIPTGRGAWLNVRPPPGHDDAECWVFVVNENFQTAYGGPTCFGNVTP